MFAYLINLKKMLQQEREKMYEEEIKPMTLKQYEERLNKAIVDYKSNRVTTGKKLKKKISTWK